MAGKAKVDSAHTRPLLHTFLTNVHAREVTGAGGPGVFALTLLHTNTLYVCGRVVWLSWRPPGDICSGWARCAEPTVVCTVGGGHSVAASRPIQAAAPGMMALVSLRTASRSATFCTVTSSPPRARQSALAWVCVLLVATSVMLLLPTLNVFSARCVVTATHGKHTVGSILLFYVFASLKPCSAKVMRMTQLGVEPILRMWVNLVKSQQQVFPPYLLPRTTAAFVGVAAVPTQQFCGACVAIASAAGCRCCLTKR